jgi:Immunoglobulin domain
MKLLGSLAAIVLGVLLNPVLAQERTAVVGGNSRSLYFSHFQRLDFSSHLLDSYFTTYDGTTGIPLYQPFGNIALYSGEVRQRTNEVDSYEADFATYNQGVFSEYGSVWLSLPSTDADGNGLPDICQSNRAVNLTGFQARTGAFYSDSPFPRTDGVTALAMARSTNQVIGNYTIKLSSEPNPANGTFQSLNISGGVSYNRAAGTMTFTFAITDPPVLQPGQSRTVTGSANYSANNPNQIVVQPFTVAGGGVGYTFKDGMVLTRSGSRYVGSATLNDGVPETSWRDFVDWVIEINDPNDWDGNGIPDISDTIPTPPFIITQPQPKTAVLTSNVTFSVTAGGSTPLTYQWQAHGTNIPGGTGAGTITLTNVQLAAAGDYRVIASNGGGSATSQVAVLTVIFPPQITDQPQNQSVIEGDSAQFNIAAIGSDPLYYQWRHEGTNLPGRIDPILFIPSVQLVDGGNYTCVVSNAAGTKLSSSAFLAVNFPPPPVITNQPQSFSVATGATAQFAVGAEGVHLNYQWKRSGTNLAGSTGTTLVLNNVQAGQSGIYSVTVSNRGGVVASSNAILYVGYPLMLTNFVRSPNTTVRMQLIGRPNTNYVFEGSSNLVQWIPLATNSAANGIPSFTNAFSPPTTAPTNRFYRARPN